MLLLFLLRFLFRTRENVCHIHRIVFFYGAYEILPRCLGVFLSQNCFGLCDLRRFFQLLPFFFAVCFCFPGLFAEIYPNRAVNNLI